MHQMYLVARETFDLTGIDIESIKEELPLKKKELDSKFDVDPQKSDIRIDDFLL
jgi:hypothetical protein